VTDKKGNNLLTRQKEFLRNIIDYKDADGRLIIQEEIDAVNTYGAAFLKTRFNPKDPKIQLMYLKDFGHYDWFFGTSMKYLDEYNRIKENIISILSAVQTDPDEYYYIVNSEGRVIYHPNMQLGSMILNLKDKDGFAFVKEQIRTAKEGKNEHVNYISKSRRYNTFSSKTSFSFYFEPFDWIVTTGFYALNIQQAIDSQQEELKKEIEEEIRTILIFSFAIAILVILMTLGFARTISDIFLNYKKNVQAKEDALLELNDSLKARVMKEVEAQREKEKMLIQEFNLPNSLIIRTQE
jgi:signal transduction histidine kinase